MSDAKGDAVGIPQPGEVVSAKYRVERVLGAGGMGVVLAAQHLELGQPVAIKFLNAQYAHHTEVVARFLREARAAAAVRSEHVAKVLDVARTEAGVPYIVMEHLDGADLDQVVRARGPLPVADAVDYLLQACEAVAEAHAARIVHRDLKPGNLFLTRRADGSPLVKVLDFGMSKVVAAEGAPHDGSLTSPAAMLGSPWYMSPEQVKASKYVDHRTDVWALGVILYRLTTGGQPFEAETLSSCLVKIVTDPPIPPRARRPDLPEQLQAVILRSLEKDVDRRLQNVAELAWALLPFAPEGSRISVERIVRVLLGSDVLTEKTLPLSAAASAPLPVASAAPAPVPAAPVPPEPSTAATVARAPAPVARPASRWPLAAGAVLLFLAGIVFVAARISAASHVEPSLAASVAPPLAATPLSEATAPTPAPTPAEPPPLPSAAEPAPPPTATSPPALPSAPPQKTAPLPKTTATPALPVKRKVTGPMETTL
jgi:serine/threonine-protein kinase